MGKVVDVFKAILTRLIFAGHGFVAIWRVTSIKNDPSYWYLSVSLLILAFEGIFTLTIKANQEWRWFCPSVFLYLSSVVPSIWLIEIDKLDKRLEIRERETNNVSLYANFSEELPPIQTFGVEIKIPVQLSAETWATVIEQFLMLILIIGRWLLPKGDLTREQLSQLLLVYIGTAADIIEFFDSYKDDKIAYNQILCYIILSIWSWSLLQFTIVLTSKVKKTKVVAPKIGCAHTARKVCCSIDVWSILMNIILQDAPFFTFRLLLIVYYKIISYMNIFFTCKNTLVIILQFYRLVVVQLEKRKALKERLAGRPPNKKSKGAQGRIPDSKGAKSAKNPKPGPSKSPPKKPPKKSTRRPARLTRTASQDDGTYSSPGHTTSYVLEVEPEPWRQHRRTRRRSVSTGDLDTMAESGEEEELETTPGSFASLEHEMERGAAIRGRDHEDFPEEEEEEEEDVDEDTITELACEGEEDEESGSETGTERKRQADRYSLASEMRASPIPAPRGGRSQMGSTSNLNKPVPLPRKALPVTPLSPARSSSGRSAGSRSSQAVGGARAKKERRQQSGTPRQDTGYSTASSSNRESPGNHRRDGLNAERSTTPNRESGRRVVRPRELRGVRSRDLRGLEDEELAESPSRLPRSPRSGRSRVSQSSRRGDMQSEDGYHLPSSRRTALDHSRV